MKRKKAVVFDVINKRSVRLSSLLKLFSGHAWRMTISPEGVIVAVEVDLEQEK